MEIIMNVSSCPETWQPGQPFSIILFYRYVFIEDVSLLLSQMQQLCTSLGLLGRLLIAKEGINGTLAGSCSCIEAFVECMKKDRRFQHIDWKKTLSEPGQYPTSLPFLNLSIRESNEIVSSGKLRSFFEENAPFDEQSFGGLANTGTHLKPHEFHAHLMALNDGYSTIDSNQGIDRRVGLCNTNSLNDEDDEESRKGKKGLVFDIRNQFEYDIGRFEHATSLNCATYAGNAASYNHLLTPTHLLMYTSTTSSHNL